MIGIKNSILIGFCCLISFSAAAQSLISTAGKTAKDGMGHEISYTLGDCFTTSLVSHSHLLTQGFLQAELVIPLAISNTQTIELRVFPNPFTNYIEFCFSDISTSLQLVLNDMTGKTLLQTNISPLSAMQLQWQTADLSSGTYSLVVYNTKNEAIKSFLLVKN